MSKNKTVVERFKIGGSAGHPSMPSNMLQRAIGTKIEVDIANKTLYVLTSKGHIAAARNGDTIICYDDCTFDVEKAVEG